MSSGCSDETTPFEAFAYLAPTAARLQRGANWAVLQVFSGRSVIETEANGLCAGRRRTGVGAAAVEADLVGRDEGWGAVRAGDVCDQRDLAQRVTGWLFGF